MKRATMILLLAVLSGTGWLVWHLQSAPARRPEARAEGDPPPPPTTDRPLLLKRSADCRACHPGVYAEWQDSHHRLAYTNPEVQRLSRQFQDKDCLPCHLPRPVFETGLGVRVLERATRKQEGVDCFTCHRAKNACLGVGDPTPAGARAPCNPLTYAPLASPLLCAPCHDQHKVHRDWKETRFARPGPGFRDCNACHMPEVQRQGPGGRARKGRSHRFLGAHDSETVKSAVTLQVDRTGPGLLMIRVANTGAGHNFPADERHRAVDLEIQVSGEQGAGASASFRVDRFRNPYREEFAIKNPLRSPGARASWTRKLPGFGEARVDATRVPASYHPQRTAYYPESTQIPAGEARTYTVQLPKGVKAARVRLWFRTQPYQKDEASCLLAEERVTF